MSATAGNLRGFFNDDGTPVNPDLMPKPSLCITCRHDNDPQHEELCALNCMDQQGTDGFKCDAYENN